MKIGIDLTPLQGPHRMRGIGYALLNIMNNIPENAKQKHSFVFFLYPETESKFGNPIELLKLEGINYKIRYIEYVNKKTLKGKSSSHLNNGMLARKIRKLTYSSTNLLRAARTVYLGDTRHQDLNDIDIYFQADPLQVLPHRNNMKTILIIYDAIPYVLKHDYLRTYSIARQNGHSRKGSLRLHFFRWTYAKKLQVNSKRATQLLAISEHTKKDFQKFLGIDGKKIRVTPLGVSLPAEQSSKQPELKHYIETSWGYMARPYTYDSNVPFILFVGGVDSRRKIVDLVTAFNHVRGLGFNLKLLLSGDILQGPDNIPVIETRTALKTSSYADDIIYMGFSDDTVRDWLYRNALSFVYPSRYEGFGLPILEAMIFGCPVICYDNSAVREIGGTVPLYADNATDIQKHLTDLLMLDQKSRDKIQAKNIAHAQQFKWENTGKKVFEAIEKV